MRKKIYKTYTFGYDYRGDKYVDVVDGRTYRTTRKYLSDKNYNYFVTIANADLATVAEHRVAICAASEGIAWKMTRFSQPIKRLLTREEA